MINSFFRGNTVKLPITFKMNGTPIDITGVKVYFTLKKRLDEEIPVLQKIIDTHTNPALGQTEILLLPDETKIEATEYNWDITVEFNPNDIVTIKNGKVKVLQGTTDVV